MFIQDIAYDALINAQLIHHDIGGPIPRGAIVAYCEGRICSSRMAQECTQIELNEFKRLALPAYVRWLDTHQDVFLCQPVHGRCRYPDESIHRTECRYRDPLPPDIQYPPPTSSRSGHGHHAHGSHHGHGQHAHGRSGGHSRIPGNSSGSHHESERRGVRIGGHHGHLEKDNVYDDSYFGHFDDGNDDDEAALSDDEDVFTRTMTQASNHGFISGSRRGGMGRGGRTSPSGNGNDAAASRHGAAVRNGRDSGVLVARGEIPRGPSSNAGASQRGTAPADTTSLAVATTHSVRTPSSRTAQGTAPTHTTFRTAAVARGDQVSLNISAQGAAAPTSGGKVPQGEASGPRNSRNAVSKRVTFQLGSRKAKAGVSEDY